ncbi:MAG: cytochrome c [Woeseiaceae bacterium]|nr:cytochrome c [Woeseiaceae bacterium]
MRLLHAIWIGLGCSAAIAQEPSGDAARGEALYERIACYSCHGYNGTGLTPLTKASGALASESVFLTYMRLRGEKTQLVPSRRMPHYSEDVMSDDEVRDLYAYLMTLEDDAPPAEEIPPLESLLDAARKKVQAQ